MFHRLGMASIDCGKSKQSFVFNEKNNYCDLQLFSKRFHH